MSRADLPKTYRPADHEPRVWALWSGAGAFRADPARVLRGEALPYCVLIPPPNVTAALHLGHALNNTLQDVLVRVHRMKGYEALWMPGTDHAGIATQTVVDRRLREAGQPALAEHKAMEARGENGREQFVAKIQAWKDEYEARITDQLVKMGCSCDWDRQRFTMDAVCARAVREAFFRLFRDGLIERGKRLVNWDPVTQTALADDEVENKEVDGFFYYLRYPLVHVSAPGDHRPVTWGELSTRGYPGAEAHAGDDQAWITVATTRPETYLGDVAVAINPRDPRGASLRGLRCELPLVGRVIPIIEDDYVVLPVALGGPEGDPKAEFATGFLKVTPAHDANDWDLGHRHRARIEAECSAGTILINVMAPDASISAAHGWPDFGAYGRNPGCEMFVGLSREAARKKVVEAFKAHTINREPLLEGQRAYRHSVGHSYRSHAAIEPYLSDQWYCRVTDDRLRGAAQRALAPEQRSEESLAGWEASRPGGEGSGDGALTMHPARYARTYETWHDNLRDWCISRQLWWGHRIPVWLGRVSEDARARFASVVERYGTLGRLAVGPESADGVVSVCVRDDGDREVAGLLEEMGLSQDRDVLDTWFSSALWPLSTMGWPADDLPVLHPKQVDQGDTATIRSIWVKRVGTWRSFVGTRRDGTAELIDELLRLRDMHKKSGGPRVLSYQLYSEADLLREGDQALPLLTPDQIQNATDMVCAVAVKSEERARTDAGQEMSLPQFLLKHGFQDTAGLLAAFNPTSALCTAREIITLWVSRMVMFNRHFLGTRQGAGGHGEEMSRADGQVPFRDVFIHAMIQDGEGRKMSKSLGNGVDPLDIIDSHGADAMRFTLVQMTTQTQDVRMPVEKDAASGKNTSPKFDLGRNFCNKLWNAARFAMGLVGKGEGDGEGTEGRGGVGSESRPTRDAGSESRPTRDAITPMQIMDRWMLSRIARATGAIEAAVDGYMFKEVADGLYDLLWRDFCDVYLEAIKPTVAGDATQRAVLRASLDAILRLLHPVVPFVTEAIFEQLSMTPRAEIAGLRLDEPRKGGTLATAGWPVCGAGLVDDGLEARVARVMSLITVIRDVRSKHQVKPSRAIVVRVPGAVLDDLRRDGADALVRTLANVGRLEADGAAAGGGGGGVEATWEACTMVLSDLADAVDASAERERLTKEAADLTKSIGALEGRLANPGYVAKAPPALVQQTQQQIADAKAKLAAVQDALGRLA